jgi:hypothetical protein
MYRTCRLSRATNLAEAFVVTNAPHRRIRDVADFAIINEDPRGDRNSSF